MATQQAVKIQAVKDVQQSIVDGVRRLRSLGIQSRRIANSMNLIMQASQELQYYIMESSYPAGTYPEGK